MISSRPLHRAQSLHEQTYQALRMAILSGELAAGDRLIETHLAERLHVSRTPVREALRQLQRENLVKTEDNGGLRVALLSIADAVHLYDCRIALEQMSVTAACQTATTAQLEGLDRAILQAEKSLAQQPHELTHYQLLHLDYQFHRLMGECSGNPWLVTLLDQVFDKMALLRLRTLQHNPKVLEIRAEHRQIYQAIVQRDTEVAIAAIQSHLRASKQRVIQEIRELESADDLDSSS